MDSNRNKTATRPIVKIKDGVLRGRSRHTQAGSDYYSFQGIPFAKPPVGELRFKAPQPPEPWTDIRDAGQEGFTCVQAMIKVKLQPESWSIKDVSAFMATVPTVVRRVGKILRQSEDCLYLNVYSPELPRGDSSMELRPVMVWIHGGGFIVGDGDSDMYGADYFVDMDIVVVSINYRLGPLGFLGVGTEAAPGNAGLKDQSMALRWVRDNIAAFGGDPNRVTIFGESAGAASAHLHTLSPLSRGLFHGVIASSGSAMPDWALTSKHLMRARQLGKLLGIESTEPGELVAALRKVSAERLVRASTKLRSHLDRFITDELSFLPVVEPPGPDAFLCEEPSEILRQGRQAAVPVVFGTNSREGLLWLIGNPGKGNNSPQSDMMRMFKRPECFVSDSHYASMSPEQRLLFNKEIVEYYFGEKGLGKHCRAGFIDLFGDLMFLKPLYWATKLHAATASCPVYVYHFAFEGKLAFMRRLFRFKDPGAAHGDELGYLFRSPVLPEMDLGPESPEIVCRNRMLQLWTNFVKTGNPTPPEAMDDLGVSWQPASSTAMQYLHISDTLSMRNDPLSEGVTFWDALYRKYLGTTVLI